MNVHPLRKAEARIQDIAPAVPPVPADPAVVRLVRRHPLSEEEAVRIGRGLQDPEIKPSILPQGHDLAIPPLKDEGLKDVDDPHGRVEGIQAGHEDLGAPIAVDIGHIDGEEPRLGLVRGELAFKGKKQPLSLEDQDCVFGDGDQLVLAVSVHIAEVNGDHPHRESLDVVRLLTAPAGGEIGVPRQVGIRCTARAGRRADPRRGRTRLGRRWTRCWNGLGRRAWRRNLCHLRLRLANLGAHDLERGGGPRR